MKSIVKLSWLPSSSEDVNNYLIYSQRPGDKDWISVASIPHADDSIYSYSVSKLEEGVRMNFTVLAVDRSGLESPPAQPISASRLISAVKLPVKNIVAEVDRTEKRLQLKWEYEETGVLKYQIYKAKEGEPIKLYNTVPGNEISFEDRQLAMNTNYVYQIVAHFKSGSKSAFSERIIVKY